MPIPPFDNRGLLPEGVFNATLEEIPPALCFNDHRALLWGDFIRFIPLLKSTAPMSDSNHPFLFVCGSFVSDKALPNDIEITIQLSASCRPDVLMAWIVLNLHNHANWKNEFNVDFYPSIPGLNDLTEFFQYAGDKTASAKNIGAKDKRGILRVSSW